MPLLEAFLALALTMLALATLATVGVEMAHRILCARGKNLKRMLEIFYKTELEQIVNSHFDLAGEEIDKKRNEIIDDLIRNPLVPEKTRWVGQWLKDQTYLSTDDMLKRLQQTPAGAAILSQGVSKANVLLDNVIAKYDEFGTASSELFKSRAQCLSLFVGVVVAFALNVDALFMFQVYLEDPDTRFAVTSNAESITQKWEEVYEGVKKAKEVGPAQVAPETDPTNGETPAVTEATRRTGKPLPKPLYLAMLQDKQEAEASNQPETVVPDAATTEAQANLDAIEADLESIKKLATDLQENFLAPVGYRETIAPLTLWRPLKAILFPGAEVDSQPTTAGAKEQAGDKEQAGAKEQAGDAKVGDGSEDPSDVADADDAPQHGAGWYVGYLLLWGVRVLGTGLLVGLGGPFWFNIVQKLASVSGQVGAASATPDASAAAMRAPAAAHPAFFAGAMADDIVSAAVPATAADEGGGEESPPQAEA